MIYAQNKFTQDMLRTIPLKLVSWLHALNVEFNFDQQIEVNGVIIDISESGGRVQVSDDKNTLIEWDGKFPEEMRDVRIGHEMYSCAMNHLGSFVMLENLYYDRFQKYQDQLEH